MLIFCNYITLSSRLNDNQLELITKQLENLQAHELGLAANFFYWSYLLSKHDAVVRNTHTQFFTLIALLRTQIAEYSCVNTEELKNKKKSLGSFLAATVKRNRSFKSWQKTVEYCQSSNNTELKQCLERIETLGQEIVKKEISNNTALFDQIKKESNTLDQSGKQLVLAGKMLHAFGEKKVAVPTTYDNANMLDLVAFDSACKLMPLLEKESEKVEKTLSILELQKIELLEVMRDFFYELYLLLYTTANKTTSERFLFKLIHENNNIEQEVQIVLPLPEDILKN